ncbi:uncharacterized protein LOC136028392 [Artemia franciscana]|uniref:uncharacterized protein LOC136028392 n=1 Tax=Artemia franciscana TaxID=6661 RepID=UPI0032DA9968
MSKKYPRKSKHYVGVLRKHFLRKPKCYLGTLRKWNSKKRPWNYSNGRVKKRKTAPHVSSDPYAAGNSSKNISSLSTQKEFQIQNQSLDFRHDDKQLSDKNKELFEILSPKYRGSEDNRLKKVIKTIEQVADINAQSVINSDNKNTALHIATLNGYKSVVEYLLGYPDLRTDIKNDKGETAFDLLEKKMKNKKLCNRNIYEDIKKILKDRSDFAQKTAQTIRGEMADKYEDMVFCMVERAGRTKFRNSEFKIGREIKTRDTNNQKFDDVVFSYKENDQRYIIPIQVKHKGGTKNINNFDLIDPKGEFSLQKYFFSYLDLKQDIRIFTEEKSSLEQSLRPQTKGMKRENEEANKKKYFEGTEVQYMVLFTSANFDKEQLEKANFTFKKETPLGILEIFDLSPEGPQKNNNKNYKQLDAISDELKTRLLQTISEFENQNKDQHRLTKLEQEEEIKNFLNRLVFVINQPKANLLELALSGLNQQEIFKGTPFNEILGNSFKQYRQNLEKGLLKKGGRPSGWIDGEIAVSYFKELEHNIETSVIVASMTIMYNKQILSHGSFESSNILTGLDQFLDDDNGQVLFLQTSEPLFSSIKLLQYLQTRNDYSLEKDNRISLALEEVLRTDKHKEAVVNKFNGSATNLLIIECDDRSYSQESLFDLYNSLLSSITQKGSKKKIILVNQKDRINALSDHFRYTNALKHYELNNEIDMQDFKPCEDPFEKKLILLQGKGERTSLNQWLYPFPRDIIDINVLADLVRGKDINVGSQLKDLGETKNYYIDRRFHQVEINAEIENDTSIQDKLVYTKESFDLFCETKPNANIHWLKSKPGKLIWQKSQGSVSQLRKYVKSGRSLIDHYSESEFLDHIKEQKVIIISDTAGMGKTTVLTSLSEKIKDKYPSKWMIRIDLIKHSDQLNILNNQVNSSQFNGDQAIDFLLNRLLKLDDGLEKKLLENNLRFGSVDGVQVVILIDGFDEIAPDYKDIVINLLAELKKTKLERLLVTTRPNMKTDLENTFGVLAYDLEPFSKDSDQVDFLVKFWKHKFKQEKVFQVDDQQLEVYGNELIARFSSSATSRDPEFTSNPLHIWMVANIFYENKERKQTKQWQGCKEFLKTPSIPNKNQALPTENNIAALYERFVETIFYDIHLKEKQEIDFTKPRIKRSCENDYKRFIENFKDLAIQNLFNRMNLDEMSSKNKENKLMVQINDWIPDNIIGSENQGIIDQFTHATFVEYFASLAFAEDMVEDTDELILYLNSMDQILPYTSHIFINSIIHHLQSKKRKETLALLKGKPLINFATLIGFLNVVKALLTSGNDEWPYPDEEGRTPLHYAVQYDKGKIMTYLLSYYDDVFEETILEHGNFKREEYKSSKLVHFVNKKDIHGKTALYYAIENNGLEIACDLLLKGADSTNFNVKLLVSYVIEQVRGASAAQDHKLRSIEEKLLLQDPSPTAELSLHYQLPRLLSYFFWNGRLEVIKAILNTIKDPEKKKYLLKKAYNNHTPLDRVNLNGDLSDDDRLKITKYLVDNGAIKTNFFVGIVEKTACHYTKILAAAARDGHIKTFQHFESEDKDNLNTYLYMACHFNNFNIIQYLYDSYAETTALHENGNTALHAAIDSGANLKIIKYLIGRGENVNAKNSLTQSPLFMAIFKRRRLNIIKYLISHGADVNLEDNSGKTPLFYAMKIINDERESPKNIITCQVEDTIEYLLVHCNANIPESFRNQAELFKNPDGFNLNRYFERSLRLHFKDPFWIKFITRKNGNVNLTDRNGNSLLHWAAELQQIEIVELLLQHGAMYNVINLNGSTPLEVLTSRHPDLLNEKGEKIVWLLNTLDQLFNSKISTNRLLLCSEELEMRDFGPYTKGYPVDNPIMFMLNAQDNQKNSLVHLATNRNDKQALTLLLKANHDYLTEKRFNLFFKDYQPKFINAANNEGNMPIHIAAREGNTDIVHLLLENGAIFNAKNEEGYTPKELSNDHIVDQLLKSVNMFLNVNDGKSKQIMQEYINKQGASVYINARDSNHKTALHHAVASSRIDIIKLLLQNNADPNALDVNHYTPLHFAVENNYMEVVELLLTHGAYFNIKNKQGKSPFDHIENKTFDSVSDSCSNLLGSINELFIGIESDDPESTINYFKIRCLQQTYRINIETIINVRDDLGNTLLHYAADYAYRDIVKLLLQHGAIFNRKNKFEYPPINFASRDIYDLLNSINEIFDHINCMYSAQVDMKIIRNFRNEEGMIILHAVVKEGNLNSMIALLKAGASIDAEDIHDNRPLDYAQQGHIKNILEASRDLLREVRSNNVNNVEKLIAREAVVSSSALLLAVKHGYCEIVKSMLKSFIVNVELEYILKSMDEDGNSGLHLALGHGHYEIAKILLAYAKNINDNGTTLKQLIETANHANKKPFDLSTDKNKSKEVTEAMFN